MTSNSESKIKYTLPKSEQQKMDNIILIMTDEERFPVHEENEQIRAFRDQYMPGHKFFKENATEFKNHMINSSACRPSRSNIFTGHPIHTTRVRNTNGFAKQDSDPGLKFDLFNDSKNWFPSNYLPTMGHYFRALGYKTYYVGKWHISHEEESEHDKKKTNTHTVSMNGKRIDKNYQAYKARDPLDKFGFTGWVGDEPHGPSSKKSGIYVDPHYTDQVIEILNKFNDPSDTDYGVPFLIVVSYVNPHDIVLWSRRIVQSRVTRNVASRSSNKTLTPFEQTLVPDLSHVPKIPKYVSDQEDLGTKPITQSEYRKVYPTMLMNRFVYDILDGWSEEQKKYYYHMMHMVSLQIQKLLDHLKKMCYYENLYMILTSDHGELLGSHKGLQQKWHCAYYEVIHVPMFVFHSKKLNVKRVVNDLTCHLDLIPSMIGLVLRDVSLDTRIKLLISVEDMKNKFICQNDLDGSDVSDLLIDYLCTETESKVRSNKSLVNRSVYFNTEDQISRGESPHTIVSRLVPITKWFFKYTYKPVKGADCVEAVITQIDLTEEFVSLFLKKYKNFLDKYDPHHIEKIKSLGSTSSLVKLVRYYSLPSSQIKYPDEWELYVRELDPSEIINIASQQNVLHKTEGLMFDHLFKRLCEKSYNQIEKPRINVDNNSLYIIRSVL